MELFVGLNILFKEQLFARTSIILLKTYGEIRKFFSSPNHIRFDKKGETFQQSWIYMGV